MRCLSVRLTGETVELHPLVPTLTDPEVVREARMIDWSASFDPPRSTVLLSLDADLDGFEAILSGTDVVLEYEVARFGDDRGYAYVHSKAHPTEQLLFEALTAEGLVLLSPIEYGTDGVELRIVGPDRRLQAAVEAIPEGVRTSIERIGEYDLGGAAVPRSMPNRQREALEAALELGYYEVPRRATREDVAERLGCAPSTASEHLQKAEGRLVEAFFGRSG